MISPSSALRHRRSDSRYRVCRSGPCRSDRARCSGRRCARAGLRCATDTTTLDCRAETRSDRRCPRRRRPCVRRALGRGEPRTENRRRSPSAAADCRYSCWLLKVDGSLGRLEEAFTLFLDEAAEGERRPIGQALQRGCISRLARQLPGSGCGRAEGGDMISHDGVHRSARVRFSERQQLVPPGLARDGHEADWPRELLAQHARHLGVAEQLGAWRILDHAALETLGVQESQVAHDDLGAEGLERRGALVQSAHQRPDRSARFAQPSCEMSTRTAVPAGRARDEDRGGCVRGCHVWFSPFILSTHAKNLLKLNPPKQYSGSSGAVAVSKKALFKGTDCDRRVILTFIMDIAIGSPLSRSPHSAESETLGEDYFFHSSEFP